MKQLPRMVATYTRKSSKSETKQSQSHERQDHEVRSFCEQNNLIVVKEFSDTQSAWKGNGNDRPGFMKLIDWLDQNAGHIAVMTEVSRVARCPEVWEHIGKRIRQFRFIELGIQEPNEMVVGIFLSLAKAESDKISHRVKSAYDLRVSKFGKGNFAWGNPDIHKHSEKGRETIREKVRDCWEPTLIVDAYLYKLGKLKQGERVIQLNKLGHRTRNNKPITASNLCKAHRIMRTGGVAQLAKEVVL